MNNHPCLTCPDGASGKDNAACHACDKRIAVDSWYEAGNAWKLKKPLADMVVEETPCNAVKYHCKPTKSKIARAANRGPKPTYTHKICKNPGCPDAGTMLPLDAYAPNKNNRDGRTGKCKKCINRMARELRYRKKGIRVA